ncbi:hypothetical protein CDCA_CDCA07G2280 [Cyanidium caldarium]|uniref:Uncharacterized protein n=1 Tax=Cyanidium caldarium TaxID=2771 RepID=A0AAV9IVB8_CYACA|nr:hypothetical protein CDCA_CDCA07G2280 [Cyanidium caldarium]
MPRRPDTADVTRHRESKRLARTQLWERLGEHLEERDACKFELLLGHCAYDDLLTEDEFRNTAPNGVSHPRCVLRDLGKRELPLETCRTVHNLLWYRGAAILSLHLLRETQTLE